MSSMLVLQLIVLLAAIALGSRMGGVGMGLWGGVGLVILIFALMLLRSNKLAYYDELANTAVYGPGTMQAGFPVNMA